MEGWDTGKIECKDSQGNPIGFVVDHTATFDLPADETVTCTFNDNKQGTITVEKVVIDGEFAPTLEFNFTTSYGDTFALAHGGTHTSQTLPSGVDHTYTVSETKEAGWVATSYCQATNSDIFNGGGSVQVTIPVGGSVYCTFTNSMQLYPGSKGFWRNWSNHYSDAEMRLRATQGMTGTAVYEDLFNHEGQLVDNALDVIDAIYDFREGGSADQMILAEYTALRLDLAVSKDPAVTHLQMHDDICMECLMDLSELPGAEELIRELNPGPIAGPITIGDVVAAVENSWNGSLVDASVLPVPDPSLWTFEAPVYYGESMGETEKILLSRIVRGIVQGWELVVDPSTYTGTPGCLLWTDESIVNIVLPDEGTVGTPYSHTLDGIWVSPI